MLDLSSRDISAGEEYDKRRPANWPEPDESIECGEEELGEDGRGANEEDIK